MTRSVVIQRILTTLTAIYWLLLFVATHIPLKLPKAPLTPSDKTLHLVAFGLLALLLGLQQASRRSLGWQRLLLLWAGLTLYAALDEWTQGFVGRYPDPLDWVADTVGITLGLILTALISKSKLVPYFGEDGARNS